MRNTLLWIIALHISCFELIATTSESRVCAYIILKDYADACQEAELSLKHSKNSKILWEGYLKSLARCGRDKDMLKAWNEYLEYFPEEKYSRSVLEQMAWGIIEHNVQSSSPIVRTYVILGAFFGQDARGVDIIKNNLKDPNAYIRSVALQFAANFRDVTLQDEVLALLEKEANCDVKVDAIKAVGRMKIKKAQPLLVAIIADDCARAEEKLAAIESLVYLLEKVGSNEVQHLVNSQRAGLRQLACHVVRHAEQTELIELIIPLLKDNHVDVRCAALQTIGSLWVKNERMAVSKGVVEQSDTGLGQPDKEIGESNESQQNSNISKHDSNKWDAIVPILDSMTRDRHPNVSITASWALSLSDPEKGQAALKPWLSHEKQSVRLLATSALVASGKYGFPLIQEVFQQTNQINDPYVRLNLAMGLASQRKGAREACEAIYEIFTSKNEKWMKESKGPFEYIAPSQVKYTPVAPNQPEVVNQLVRLEVLNMLSILEDPSAQPAIYHFLNEKSWGVTGMAAVLLLTEGDESALEIVESLLQSKNHKVSVQAAIILALWGKDERAINVLIESYSKANRDMKERILESLGHIGAKSTIPFLTERLQESAPTLRIIAASSLLQCLYH